MWKPYELRKMLAFVNASTNLRKVFYSPPSCPCYTKVHFTDSTGQALDSVSKTSPYAESANIRQEDELDLQAEYTDWLWANRDRKAIRDSWGF